MPPSLPAKPAAPFVVAVGGRVASGKSTVARVLATHLGVPHIEADRVRDALLERDAGAEVHESRWHRSFGPLFAQEVYAELRHRAERALAGAPGVVVDACFPLETQRAGLHSLARRLGLPFLFVECDAGERITAERLAERDARAEHPGWSSIADELARHWEPVEALARVEHLALDTGRPVEPAVADVVARLADRSPDPELQRPDAVTFDCWNTLIFEPAWQDAHTRRVAALTAAAAEAGCSVSHEQADHAFSDAWEQHMRLWGEGVASGAGEVAVWALAALGLRDPHPALEHLTTRFEEASHSQGVAMLPGTRETLERLAGAGIRRALVCDTGLTPGRVVRRHLEHHGLLALLEVQVFSDEIGVPKPDPRAFEAALTPLGVSPQRALHVGDLRRTDVAGARGIGMATARIRERHDDTTPLPEADHVVSGYEELQALLPH